MWDIVLLNVRMRDYVEGDLHCQVGAVHVGADDLVAMLDKFGTERVLAAADAHLVASERHMAAEIQAIQDGVYTAERIIESGGAHHQQPIHVRLEVTVADDRITFDFRGSDPQVRGYANSTYANTVASCCVGLFSLIDPDLGMNSGSTAPITVITEPGTIVHAVEPAATTLCTLSATESIVESIWLALADAVPNGSNAGWSRIANFGEAGIEESTGRPFAAMASFGGGGSGATLGADGWDSLGTPVTMGGAQARDPEQHELTGPVTVLGYGLTTDSGGAGQWRGGLGVWTRYRVEQDNLPSLYWGGGTSRQSSPFGLHGGHGGQPNRGVVERRDGTFEPVLVNTITTLNRGDIVHAEHTGGGGFGDPAARDADIVVRDVLDGRISPAAAREIYRVALDAAGAVDAAATAALRASSTTTSETTPTTKDTPSMP